MSELTRLRDHCRTMADAEHKPDCPSITARKPFWDCWEDVRDDSGRVTGMRWLGLGPKWEPPRCDGCISDGDRELFARIAGEVDDYLTADQEPTLLELSEPTSSPIGR